MTTFLCTGCGTRIDIDPAVGGVVRCPGCGKNLGTALPDAGPVVDPDRVDMSPVEGTATARVRRRKTSSSHVWLAAAVAAAVVVLIAGASVVVWSSKSAPTPSTAATAPLVVDEWADRNRDQLRQLKSQAESLVLDGDLRGGFEKYRAIQALATGHAVADPSLQQLLQDSRAAQDKLFDKLLASGTSAPAQPPASVPPEKVTTQSPATTPPAPVEPADAASPLPSPGPVSPRTPATARPNPVVPAAVGMPGHDADQRIGVALDAGIDYLIGLFQNGQVNDGDSPDSVHHQGLDALCVYALLHAGQGSGDPRLNVQSPFVKQIIQALKSYPMNADPAAPMTPVVYARSLRAAALSVYNRREDVDVLRADVAWLVAASFNGAYSYDDRAAKNRSPGQGGGGGVIKVKPNELDVLRQLGVNVPGGGPRRGRPGGGGNGPDDGGLDDLLGKLDQVGRGDAILWDNSNSQYGLLGVWSGVEVGCEVRSTYWKAVEAHWDGCQKPSGQWSYSAFDPDPTLSMTCAGVASLLVTRDYLEPPAIGPRVGRQPYSPQLALGLKYLEAGDHVTQVINADTHFFGYTAYGIERVALASGFKFFGVHDWFAELAAQLIPYQFPGGTWGRADNSESTNVNTAYMVLFLSRGRHPVLMNKLRFEKFWDNRPRDLANLAKYASHRLERPMNWQVVSFDRPWSDWLDSPVLYIASHQAPALTDADYDKLKAYAAAGGLIFTNADSRADSFNKWVDALTQRLWPDLKLVDVPDDHELYVANYHLKPGTKEVPRLKMVSNGSRILLLHCPADVGAPWHENATRQHELFDLGMNIFIWAAGRSDFRNRLDSFYIPEPTNSPVGVVRVARLKYAGNSDPEPYAWTRFGRYYQWTTGSSVDVAETPMAELKSLGPGERQVAVLTGNGAVDFGDDQAAAVRTYVEAGGTLLVDCCGGSSAFATSVDGLLAKAFPGVSPDLIPLNDPAVAGGQPGVDDLTKPLVRSYVLERGGAAVLPKQLPFGTKGGRVIYSRLDLTTGLLGTTSWGINGYGPAYAERFVKNVLLTARGG